jgi:hypothetical protein
MSKPIEIEIAPGMVRQITLADGIVPQLVLAKVVRLPSGRYVLTPTDFCGSVRLSYSLPRKLGLDCTYYCLRRLVVAGFIKASTVAEKTTLIDLQSLNEHLAATRTDAPEPFWTRERIRIYMDAHGGIKGR